MGRRALGQESCVRQYGSSGGQRREMALRSASLGIGSATDKGRGKEGEETVSPDTRVPPTKEEERRAKIV